MAPVIRMLGVVREEVKVEACTRCGRPLQLVRVDFTAASTLTGTKQHGTAFRPNPAHVCATPALDPFPWMIQ